MSRTWLLAVAWLAWAQVASALPVIHSFAPSSAQVATVVTIIGGDFTGVDSVAFNGVPATFRVQDAGVLYATVPAGAGSGRISVGDAAGTATSATDFQLLASPAVLVGAGDISDCIGKAEDTAKLLDALPGTVLTLGDHAYVDGTAAEFAACYEPTWGRHRWRTRPAPGAVDYDTAGASAYFDYFGAAAGEPGKGYYSYDIGEWHVIALNSECGEIGGCSADSPQGRWLREDLLRHPRRCQVAYWASPRFSSSSHGSDTAYSPFWQILYAAGAELVVSGHDHTYERFAPQDANGLADPLGIRQFVAGTGGRGLYGISVVQPNSEVRNSSTHGVLRLALNPASYDWQFLPIAGKTFTDAGSANCRQVDQVPLVEAGPDQAVTWPAGAALPGKALDDAPPYPAGPFVIGWSQVSGPGVASFADGAAATTTVTFSQPGSYVLRLTGDDGAHVVTDDVAIQVDAVSQVRSVEARVSAGTDDAEAHAVTGVMYLDSSDLELAADPVTVGGDQLVGLRFPGVQVPRGATVLGAYVQFQVDEVSLDAAALEVRGEAVDQSAAFTSVTGNLASRPVTAASAAWVPPSWPTVGAAGADQRTTDLAPIIQEIVGRPGWASGNALALVVGGTGRRTAEAYEGGAPPILRIQYTEPDSGGQAADLGVRLTDAPDPVLLGQAVTYTTTVTNYGPGAATGVTASGTLPACTIGSLASGASASCTALVVAGGMTLATQSMSVSAVEPDPVAANNSASASTSVQAPDLRVATLAAAPSGSSLLIGDQVTNGGNGAAGAFTMRFYLSANTALDAGDTSLCTRSVASLAAGASNPVSGAAQTTCAIPAVASGSYYVIATADAGATVAESNEANNQLASASFAIAGPDLVPTAMSGARVGSDATRISVTDTIRNLGNAAVSGVTVTMRYYLSTNTTFEAGADLALSTKAYGTTACKRSLTSLAGGASNSGSKTCHKPAGAQNGVPYYLLVFDDSSNTVAESDETNNVRATTGTIQW